MLVFSYPLSPWLHDHRFAGRTVFPAVESMRVLLAAYAGMQDKGCPRLPLVVSGARFPHLIAVDRAARRLDFLVNNQTAFLISKNTVDTGNGLHQVTKDVFRVI